MAGSEASVSSKSNPVDFCPASFSSTHWSVVLAAAQDQTPSGQAALAELYQNYRYPLYAHVRRCGYNPDDADDLIQSFFLHLLEHRCLAQVDPGKGRFRSFLLASLQNLLRTEQRRERTEKRGGLCTFVSLDAQAAERRYLFEPADDRALTVEQMFDARWAVTLLDRAMANVRAKYVARGKQRIFETLKQFLPCGSSGDEATYPGTAASLGISEASVNTLIHRLRQHYALALRREVASTLSDPAAIDEEIHLLCDALAAAKLYWHDAVA